MLKTGRPARIDDFARAPRHDRRGRRETGLRRVRRRPDHRRRRRLGRMAAADSRAALPDHIEDRLAEFTELVATAISNTESRAALARLAEEQAALRRVATLVARGTRPEEVFAAVANEVGRLLSVDFANVCRYESDGTITFVASAWERIPVGSRWPLGGDEPRHARVGDGRSGAARRLCGCNRRARRGYPREGHPLGGRRRRSSSRVACGAS